jgi:hypothetical protein
LSTSKTNKIWGFWSNPQFFLAVSGFSQAIIRVGSPYAIGALMTRSENAIRNQPASRLALRWAIVLAVFAVLSLRAAINVPLAWDTSANTNVAGYKIYYGTASHNYGNSVDVGNVTTATINSLSENTTYYFAATTYDASGLESKFSNEAAFIFKTLPPTLNPIGDLSVNYNSPAQIVSLTGIGLGTGKSLAVTAVSDNPALIPNPAVSYTSPAATGTLSFAPVQNASGTAHITVTVQNNLAMSNTVTQTFTVIVTPAQPPQLNPISDVSINENSPAQSVNLTGINIGTGQSLTVTAVSDNPALIPNPAVSYTSPAATAKLNFAPVQNASGTAHITVTVDNGQSQNNLATQTFTVNVAPVNQPPTLNPIGDLTLNFNSPAQTVNLGGISSGAANEFQALTVTAISSNPQLIPNPAVNYSSPLATGSLNFTPAAKGSGACVITVTVNDGCTSNNIVTRSFAVTVNTKAASVPKPQLLDKLSDQVVLAGKTVALKMRAGGKGALKYQWKCNGTNIPNATSATLNLKNVSTKQSGLYSVVVANAAGSVISSPAAVTVLSTPAAMLTSSVSSNGAFAFNVVGVNGYKYAVQATTDMVHWTSVETNTAPFTFQDGNAGNFNQRFYRTVYVP